MMRRIPRSNLLQQFAITCWRFRWDFKCDILSKITAWQCVILFTFRLSRRKNHHRQSRNLLSLQNAHKMTILSTELLTVDTLIEYSLTTCRVSEINILSAIVGWNYEPIFVIIHSENCWWLLRRQSQTATMLLKDPTCCPPPIAVVSLVRGLTCEKTKQCAGLWNMPPMRRQAPKIFSMVQTLLGSTPETGKNRPLLSLRQLHRPLPNTGPKLIWTRLPHPVCPNMPKGTSGQKRHLPQRHGATLKTATNHSRHPSFIRMAKTSKTCVKRTMFLDLGANRTKSKSSGSQT